METPERPTPTPTPPPPPPPPPGVGAPPSRDAEVAYNIVADKIGGLPNVRKKDNMVQALAILGFTVLGGIIGRVFEGGYLSMGTGALAGLIAGTLISGTVLMVIGLIRKP